jgi:hypothetical protein
MVDVRNFIKTNSNYRDAEGVNATYQKRKIKNFKHYARFQDLTIIISLLL